MRRSGPREAQSRERDKFIKKHPVQKKLTRHGNYFWPIIASSFLP
jgi:hypothetical protein